MISADMKREARSRSRREEREERAQRVERHLDNVISEQTTQRIADEREARHRKGAAAAAECLATAPVVTMQFGPLRVGFVLSSTQAVVTSTVIEAIRRATQALAKAYQARVRSAEQTGEVPAFKTDILVHMINAALVDVAKFHCTHVSIVTDGELIK